MGQVIDKSALENALLACQTGIFNWQYEEDAEVAAHDVAVSVRKDLSYIGTEDWLESWLALAESFASAESLGEPSLLDSRAAISCTEFVAAEIELYGLGALAHLQKLAGVGQYVLSLSESIANAVLHLQPLLVKRKREKLVPTADGIAITRELASYAPQFPVVNLAELIELAYVYRLHEELDAMLALVNLRQPEKEGWVRECLEACVRRGAAACA